ncbi:MAG TPA: hypothetical protein VGY55_14645 [Pirellulales bacterium]|jgi:hypothetical protein|nr:hypothetical protein [Pirellulales bacterium]
MRTVNYHFISRALGILTIEEAQRGTPLDLDPDSEESSKRVFRQHVVPFVDRWPKWRREMLHLSLAYSLNDVDVLDRILAGEQDLTMSEPSDIRRFFLWLWETLCPEEDYQKVDLRDVVENNDMMEPNPQPQDIDYT